MVYLLKMVIYHGYVSHNQMVDPYGEIFLSRIPDGPTRDKNESTRLLETCR